MTCTAIVFSFLAISLHTVFSFTHTHAVKLNWCLSLLWFLCFGVVNTCSSQTKYNWLIYDSSWLWQQRSRTVGTSQCSLASPLFSLFFIPILFVVKVFSLHIIHLCKLRVFWNFTSKCSPPLQLLTYLNPFCSQVVRISFLSFPLFVIFVWFLCNVFRVCSFNH